MATLCLDPELGHGAWRDLHDWLGGAWAVLFSNPEDFQPLDRQKGQWLAAVHTLAVKREAGPRLAGTSTKSMTKPNWIDDLCPNRETVWLREPPFAAADPVSFAARALRGQGVVGGHRIMGKAA